MPFLWTENVYMSLCNMKTGKLMKENCSKKNFRDCWHKNKLFFIKIFLHTFAFFHVNAWPSHAVRERRCAAAVISRQRHFCSLR